MPTPPPPVPPVPPPPTRPLVPYSAERALPVPTSIRVAVWSFRAAALWGVGSAVVFWWWVRTTVDDLGDAVSAAGAAADLGLEGQAARAVERVLGTVSDDRWSGLLTTLGVVSVVVSLLAAVVYLLLARSIRRGGPGSRVARGVATALTVVSLLWLVLGPQAWVWVALNVAGVVAAWRPGSTAYLVAAREARR